MQKHQPTSWRDDALRSQPFMLPASACAQGALAVTERKIFSLSAASYKDAEDGWFKRAVECRDDPSWVRDLFSESVDVICSVVREDEIDEVDLVVNIFEREYSDLNFPSNTLHCDGPRNFSKRRQMLFVMGTPFPTITLTDLHADSAAYAEIKKNKVSVSYEGLEGYRTCAPAPGQYMLMQEYTIHTAPDVSSIKSYADAEALYGDRPEMMAWFGPDKMRRLFCSHVVFLK